VCLFDRNESIPMVFPRGEVENLHMHNIDKQDEY
jgi:hypothetical protein